MYDCLQINSRFSAASVHVDAAGAAAARAQVYVALQLDQLQLTAEARRRQPERLLYLDKLKLDAKVPCIYIQKRYSAIRHKKKFASKV